MVVVGGLNESYMYLSCINYPVVDAAMEANSDRKIIYRFYPED